MNKLEILSVAENNWCSETISARQRTGYDQFRISIDLKRKLEIIQINTQGKLKISKITVHDLDLNGLIEYLQEVQRYHNEEEMVKKLLGKQ